MKLIDARLHGFVTPKSGLCNPALSHSQPLYCSQLCQCRPSRSCRRFRQNLSVDYRFVRPCAQRDDDGTGILIKLQDLFHHLAAKRESVYHHRVLR